MQKIREKLIDLALLCGASVTYFLILIVGPLTLAAVAGYLLGAHS